MKINYKVQLILFLVILSLIGIGLAPSVPTVQSQTRTVGGQLPHHNLNLQLPFFDWNWLDSVLAKDPPVNQYSQTLVTGTKFQPTVEHADPSTGPNSALSATTASYTIPGVTANYGTSVTGTATYPTFTQSIGGTGSNAQPDSSGGGTITRIQTARGVWTSGGTFTVTFGSSPANGHNLLMSYSSGGNTNNGQVNSITETGATWVLVLQTGGSGGNEDSEIWIAYNVSGASTAVTLNITAPAGAVVYAVANGFEYSNMLTSNAVDKTASNAGGTSGSTSDTGTTATTTQPNELYFGVTSRHSGSQNTATNGFTLIDGTNTSSGSDAVEEKIVSSTGTANSGTTLVGGDYWNGEIATFKAAAGGGYTGHAHAVKITPSVGGTVLSVGIDIQGSEVANAYAGIYSDSSGSPGSLLASSVNTAMNTSSGFQDFTMTTPVFVAGSTQIWLAFQLSALKTIYYTSGAPGQNYYAKTYGAFDATWGAGTTDATYTWNLRYTFTKTENYINGIRFQYTGGSGAAMSSMSIYIFNGGGSDHFTPALYSDSAGSPSLLYWSGPSTSAVSTSWNTVNYASGSPYNGWAGTFVASTYYWLMWQWNSVDTGPSFCDGVGAHCAVGASNTGIFVAQTYASMPSTWPGGGTLNTNNWSIYVSTGGASFAPGQVDWVNPSYGERLDGNYTYVPSNYHYECPDGWSGTCASGSFPSTNADATTVLFLEKISVPSAAQPTSFTINYIVTYNAVNPTTWYVGFYTGAGVLITQSGPFVANSVGLNSFSPGASGWTLSGSGTYYIAFSRSNTGTPSEQTSSGSCLYETAIASYNAAWPSSLSPTCTSTTRVDLIYGVVYYNWTTYLQLTNYSFNLASNVAVLGLTVDAYDYATYNAGNDYVVDGALQFLYSSSPVGNTFAKADPWPTLLTDRAYGTPFWTYGYTWTPTIINSSSFGIQLVALIDSGNTNYTNTAFVDAIKITVYYSQCSFPNNVNASAPVASTSQIQYGLNFTSIATTGTLACSGEQSAVSDSNNFWAFAYVDSGNNLQLAYTYLNSNLVAQTSTLLLVSSANWQNTNTFFSLSNVQVSGSTYYFGVASYNAAGTSVQWTSVSYIYSGSNVPSPTTGSTYSVAVTDSSGYHGFLNAYLETAGYAWITMATSADGVHYGVQLFKGSATNFTGSGLASYAYEAYGLAYPNDIWMGQTSTTLYGVRSQTMFGVNSNDSPVVYRIYTSLVTPFFTGPSIMASPVSVGGDKGLNTIYYSYLNSIGVSLGAGVEFWVYSEASGNWSGNRYNNPTSDTSYNSWFNAAVAGNNSGAYVLMVMASDQNMYYYYSLNAGAALSGPFTLQGYWLYKVRNMALTPSLTIPTATSIGKFVLYENTGSNPFVIGLFGSLQPLYILQTGSTTATALLQTTSTNTLSGTSTFINPTSTSVVTATVPNYVSGPIPVLTTLLLAGVLILVVAGATLMISHTVAGMLIGVIIGILVATILQLIPIWALLFALAALILAVIFRPKGGGEGI
jgi:hypothetical protein